MNEEELIKDLTNFIAFAQKEENFTYYPEYKFVNELSEKVQDLLDLYNKEKEKTPESIIKQFEIYQNRICEKDKIIDLMAKTIHNNDICKNFIENHCINYAGENKKLCDNCIKQYFENKANEEAE